MNVPETIWTDASGKAIIHGDTKPWPNDIKWVRADLPPTPEQIMDDPRVKALVEALQYIYDNGDGYDGRSMARDALAAMDTPHER